MNPKYVTSLPLSQRLKELGFKQESDFYWVEFLCMEKDGTRWRLMSDIEIEKFCISESRDGLGIVSAPHVGELVEMLPTDIPFSVMDADPGRAYLRIDKVPILDSVNKDEIGTHPWNVSYDRTIAFTDESLVETMGEMLAYLTTNSLLNPLEI